MPLAYLSVGTNLGNRKKNIRNALKNLQDFSKLTGISKAYRTKPYTNLSQPDYINLAVRIETALEPENLMDRLISIEQRLGRIRNQKWESRIIDLDIIFYDDLIIYNEKLIIPHSDMHNRLFVLEPLMDIEPDFQHPVLKMTVRELFENIKKN